jgi:hypothetical protein
MFLVGIEYVWNKLLNAHGWGMQAFDEEFSGEQKSERPTSLQITSSEILLGYCNRGLCFFFSFFFSWPNKTKWLWVLATDSSKPALNRALPPPFWPTRRPTSHYTARRILRRWLLEAWKSSRGKHKTRQHRIPAIIKGEEPQAAPYYALNSSKTDKVQQKESDFIKAWTRLSISIQDRSFNFFVKLIERLCENDRNKDWHKMDVLNLSKRCSVRARFLRL